MSERPLLTQLMDALRCLPGVGPRSAQRIAFHLLERDREGGARLAQVMADAMIRIQRCARCRTLTERELCVICADPGRDSAVLCVVEQPSEVFAIEQATGFRGRYFVLGGRLSPLDGVGPDELGLDALEQRFADTALREVILAVSPTIEGNVTAQFIADIAARHAVQITRIAHGVPLGSELDALDNATLVLAFDGRRLV